MMSSLQKPLALEQGYELVLRGKGGCGAGLQVLHDLLHAQCRLLDLRLDVARNVEIVVVRGDFLQGYHARYACHILIRLIPAMDALDVLR